LSVDTVNVKEKFAPFGERWKPNIAGESNGRYVKL
jgi:hypothetical protein